MFKYNFSKLSVFDGERLLFEKKKVQKQIEFIKTHRAQSYIDI